MTEIKKVFVINDETDTNLLMAVVLKNKGYWIDSAGRLKEGTEMCEAVKPDLLFLDINLPDGNGLSHIGYFKKQIPNMKICVISANEDIYKAYDYHADGILMKPFSLLEIIDKTKELIG
jgi:DNA-binding response OmpR family regulator